MRWAFIEVEFDRAQDDVPVLQGVDGLIPMIDVGVWTSFMQDTFVTACLGAARVGRVPEGALGVQ